jgi:Icc-related predicted phosphoesterase
MLAYPSKVLVIADYDKPHYQENFKLNFDFALSCGNVGFPILQEIQEQYNKPIFAVKGHHDPRKPFPEFVQDVHDRIAQHRHWLIGGWQGVPDDRSDGADEWDNLIVTERLNKFPYVDIFICHAPIFKVPEQEADAPAETEPIRRYIREKQPKLVYHGYVHSKTGSLIENTAVVSVFGAEIFTLD